MPRIVPAERIGETGAGPGWVRSMLADPELVGTDAMTLERVTLEPGSEGPELSGGEPERFVYVIRGTGSLAGSADAALGPESVVWLEEGDRVRLVAGPDGMQVLVAGSDARPPTIGA